MSTRLHETTEIAPSPVELSFNAEDTMYLYYLDEQTCGQRFLQDWVVYLLVTMWSLSLDNITKEDELQDMPNQKK